MRGLCLLQFEMGVTAETDVDYGRIYGPFPAVGHIPQSHFIGYLTADERHDTGSVKVTFILFFKRNQILYSESKRPSVVPK